MEEGLRRREGGGLGAERGCGVNAGDLGVGPRRGKIEKTRMKLFVEGQDGGGMVGEGLAEWKAEGGGGRRRGVMALINKCRQRLDSKEGRPNRSRIVGAE